MLSTVLFIASVVAIVGGLAIFAIKYLPYLIDTFNSYLENFVSLSELLPDWLIGWASVGLLLGVLGLIVKLL